MTASDLEEALKAVLSGLLADMRREEGQRMVTRQEAGKRLGVDPSTLWRWDRTGYLKARRRGRAVYYLEKDVESLEKGIEE